MMICHPFLVKNDASHATSIGNSAFMRFRDKQDPLSCLNEVGKRVLVSRLRKGREKTRHSFFESALCFMPR